MGKQESEQPDFLVKLAKEKTHFEDKLEMQGYKHISEEPPHHLDTYGISSGNYNLRARVYTIGSRIAADLIAYWKPSIQDSFANIQKATEIWRKEFSTYNIEPFKEEQRNLLEFLKKQFIPRIKSEADVPEELEALLGEKK